MTYRRWDVVVVPYPFIEGEGTKNRPALVVSSDALRREHDVYWIAMITTAKAGKQPNDIDVTDHQEAGLPEDCVIRVKRLTSLSERQIGRRLGAITARDRRAVSALLKAYMP